VTSLVPGTRPRILGMLEFLCLEPRLDCGSRANVSVKYGWLHNVVTEGGAVLSLQALHSALGMAPLLAQTILDRTMGVLW